MSLGEIFSKVKADLPGKIASYNIDANRLDLPQLVCADHKITRDMAKVHAVTGPSFDTIAHLNNKFLGFLRDWGKVGFDTQINVNESGIGQSGYKEISSLFYYLLEAIKTLKSFARLGKLAEQIKDDVFVNLFEPMLAKARETINFANPANNIENYLPVDKIKALLQDQ